MREKKVHALDLFLNLLCGVRGANRTSIVRNRRDPLAKLVTCERCLRRLQSNGGAEHG